MCVVDTHMCHMHNTHVPHMCVVHTHMCHTSVVYKGFVLIRYGARNPLPNALRVSEAVLNSELVDF